MWKQLPEFFIFLLEKICFFISFQYILLINTGCSLIDFDKIFPMVSSELKNITDLWINFFKTVKNNKKNHFSVKILICRVEKIFFKFEIMYILTDMNLIFPIKPSKLEISISVESFDKKQLKITEIATLLKSTQFPNYHWYRSQILIA